MRFRRGCTPKDAVLWGGRIGHRSSLPAAPGRAGPFALVAGRLVCNACRAEGNVADGRAAIVHLASCALVEVLSEIERRGKPLMVYDGIQAVRVFTSREGTFAN